MSNTLKSLVSSKSDTQNSKRHTDGIVIAKFMGLDDSGTVSVEILGHAGRQTLSARTTTTLREEDIGRDVALMFEEGDLLKPIVIGLIQGPEKTVPEVPTLSPPGKKDPTHLEIDGERVTFTAKKNIVLRCGKASITLTRAGKVVIRGEYILSRSSGVNRIKGGSVQIN